MEYKKPNDMTNVFTCLMKKKFGNGNGSGMDRDFIGNGSAKSRKLFALLFCILFVGVGNVWGVDETLTLTYTDWETGGYGSGSTSKSTGTTSIGITYDRVYQNSSTIQMEKSNGVLYSTTRPSTNIKIKSITVNCTTNTVGLYGSLNGSTWTEISYTNNTATDVTRYAYSYFKVAADQGKYAQVAEIVVVYTEAPARTVTFNAQAGTCEESSLTEASGMAGITLPSASPASDCTADGWEFAGWKKTSAVTSETTTQPTLYTGTYYPSDDETLYAVYKKVVDATTTYYSNPICTYDYFYDIMHGNEIDAKQGTYAMPAAPSYDEPGVCTYCGEKHFHFIGWLEEQYINDDGTIKDGGAAYIIPAGETGHTANNKNYYAIWSKVE